MAQPRRLASARVPLAANSGDEDALTVGLDTDGKGDTIGNLSIRPIGVDGNIAAASREIRDRHLGARGVSRAAGDSNTTGSGSEPLLVVSREAFDKLLHLAHKVDPDFHVETSPLVRPAGGAGRRDAECWQGASERFARRLYRFRRLRADFFDSELFSEPAWDILLDLFLNQLAGRKVCVSSCCIAAAAPVTTGLRWLKHLEGLGLVVRDSDPEDARRVYVSLSRESFERMEGLLREGRRLLEPAPSTGESRHEQKHGRPALSLGR